MSGPHLEDGRASARARRGRVPGIGGRARWRTAAVLPLIAVLCACGGVETASFTLSWRLVDAKDPMPEQAPTLSCAAAGVSTIRLLLRAAGAQPVQVDFACAQQDGITGPVRRDRYTIQAQALGTRDAPLSQLAFEEENLAGARDLGLIIFQIPR